MVRGGRAYALMAGVPWWDGAFTADECQKTVSVSLAGANGEACGSVSLPVPVSADLACLQTLSSAAVALDGTVVVRTFESGAGADGASHVRMIARWWPRLLQ